MRSAMSGCYGQEPELTNYRAQDYFVCSVPGAVRSDKGRIMNPAGLRRGAGSPRFEDDEPKSLLDSLFLAFRFSEGPRALFVTS